MLYIYTAIAFFFSNHLFCKLSEFKFFHIFDLYQFSTTCLGICLLLLPVATSYRAVVVLAIMFGLMDGGRYGLMPLIVLTCVGQKRTNQAWGYVAFSVGLSSAVGPVFIGKPLYSTYEPLLSSKNSLCTQCAPQFASRLFFPVSFVCNNGSNQ